MPSIKQDKQALDWLSKNPGHQLSGQVAEKLGVDAEDIKAWDWSQKNSGDKLSVPVRNKVYEKIAQKNPAIQEQGVGFADRFVVKNLIDRDPDLQVEYLKRKGFDVRVKPVVTQSDKFTGFSTLGSKVTLDPPEKETETQSAIEVRRPGETRFSVVDPEGFDLFDVADVTTDLLEAAVTGVATGAKALGMVGAPATGGLSLAASSGLGGAATAGFETAKQFVAKTVGAREEIDPGRIAQAGILGAASPLIAKGVGAVLKGLGGTSKAAVEKISGAKLKPNVEDIKQAANVLGTKPTPGQLIDSPFLKDLEVTQQQLRGTLGGTFLRRQTKKNIETTRKVASSILDDAGMSTKTEAGSEIFDSITKTIDEKLKPAEQIYKAYSDVLGELPANKSVIKKAIKDFASRKKGDFKLKGFLSKLEKTSTAVLRFQPLG